MAGYVERMAAAARQLAGGRLTSTRKEWHTMQSSREPHQPYGLAPPGFRLPAETHIGAVRLQVCDLPRSVAYYEQVLGLRRLTAAGDAVAMGDGDRPLVVLETRAGVRPARRGVFGLYHFAILLPDRAALGRFAAHVSALGLRVGMADHLVSEALYLWDPDGLGIEVYADRPRESWTYRDRELMMTTDPLRIGELVDAGGGRSWDGAPAGTQMGHIHLHVGNLDQADAFYHRALGFDRMVWSYPGALFLAAGGYHHHLGANVWASGPRAAEHEARLLEWEIVLPDAATVAVAAASLLAAGYEAVRSDDGWTTADPWGTTLRIGVRS